MLRVRNLRAGYGSLEVVRSVSVHVAEGEIVTVIGAEAALMFPASSLAVAVNQTSVNAIGITHA